MMQKCSTMDRIQQHTLGVGTFIVRIAVQIWCILYYMILNLQIKKRIVIGCPLRRRQFRSQTVYFILFKHIIVLLDNLPIYICISHTPAGLYSMSQHSMCLSMGAKCILFLQQYNVPTQKSAFKKKLLNLYATSHVTTNVAATDLSEIYKKILKIFCPLNLNTQKQSFFIHTQAILFFYSYSQSFFIHTQRSHLWSHWG